VNDAEKVPKRPFQGSETKRSASPYLHKVKSEHNWGTKLCFCGPRGRLHILRWNFKHPFSRIFL